MVESHVPLAVATAQQLATLLPQTAGLNDSVKESLSKLSKASSFNKSLADIGLQHVPEYTQHPYLTTGKGPTASLLSTVVFSMFASLWGKVMWSTSVNLSSEYSALVQGQDPKRVRSLRKQFLRSRAVGRAVFTLLMFDYIASLLLRSSSEDMLLDAPIKIPEVITTIKPLSTVFPFVQTSLFLLGTLIMIRRQRFVVVPLLLAGAFYNRDLPILRDITSAVDSQIQQIKIPQK